MQVDACDHMDYFISDCDRKTEQAKKKLAETQEALSDEVRIATLTELEVSEKFRLRGKRIACTTLPSRLVRNLPPPS